MTTTLALKYHLMRRSFMSLALSNELLSKDDGSCSFA